MIYNYYMSIFCHRRESALGLERGMTIAEIIISIGILMVVMVAVSSFEYNVINYNRSAQVALTNTQEAENILKFMAKELRTMAPSANGSYPIGTAATSSLTFYADVDSDGLQDQVRYYLATTTLYRGTTKPTGSPATYNLANENKYVLATGVRNSSTTPSFEYFSGTYDGTTGAMTYPLTITAIRLVKVNITIDSDPTKSPVPRTFSTQVSLRNLKDNL